VLLGHYSALQDYFVCRVFGQQSEMQGDGQ